MGKGKGETRKSAKETGKSKVKVIFLVVVFVSTFFNIAISWGIIANAMSWIFDYIARPMLILLLIISIVTVIIAIGYCLVKKKSIFIITVSIFVCMVIYSSFVYSSFSQSRSKLESTKIFLDLTDVKNINILNTSDLNDVVYQDKIYASIFGKSAFEYYYDTLFDDNIEKESNYSITQETLSFDNIFFVNRKKLEEHLKFYYIEKDIWGFDITDNDIHSFIRDNVNCTYVYKTRINDYSKDNEELAYYAFVIYSNDKLYVNSYYLRCENQFVFDSKKTTERIVNELINKGCL